MTATKIRPDHTASNETLHDDTRPIEQDAGDVPVAATPGANVRRAEEAMGAANSKEGCGERPYSVYTRREKWVIVALVSFGSVFRCVLFSFV
jgi:hypothetical protein